MNNSNNTIDSGEDVDVENGEVGSSKHKNHERSSSEEYSSESSSEDEEGARLPSEFDAEFFEILTSLRKKDPCIYDKQKKYFVNTDIKDLKETHLKKKPRDESLYLKNYEGVMLMSNNGELPSEESENENIMKVGPSYVEEMQALKDSFKPFLNDSDSDDELLVTKTSAEKTAAEETPSKVSIRVYNSEDVDHFLTDYVMEKAYIKPKTKLARPKLIDKESTDDVKDVEEEEEEILEYKYNFRSEEPDTAFIKIYPRIMTDTMRCKSLKRRQKRQEIRRRKMEEKQRNEQVMKRLAAEKRKEVKQKLDTIRKATGNEKVGLDDIDLELDDGFDPEKQDREMALLLGDDKDDEDETADFLQEGDLTDENSKAAHVPHCEDPDFNMDCDFDPNANVQVKKRNLSKRKRRQLKNLERKIKRWKEPDDIPENMPKEFVDEYYQFDYEDMIQDLPCRYKYREVMPNDFGLSIEEILFSKDCELNSWCPPSRVIQYCSKDEDKLLLKTYKRKGTGRIKKRKILKNYYDKLERAEKEHGTEQAVKEPSKALHQHKKDSSVKPAKKRKKLETSKHEIDMKNGVSDSRLTAFGLNPKKYKRWKTYKNKY